MAKEITIHDLEVGKCYVCYVSEIAKKESLHAFKVEEIIPMKPTSELLGIIVEVSKGIHVSLYGMSSITSTYIVDGEIIKEIDESVVDKMLSELKKSKEIVSNLVC